jgi:hypothetical protein
MPDIFLKCFVFNGIVISIQITRLSAIGVAGVPSLISFIPLTGRFARIILCSFGTILLAGIVLIYVLRERMIRILSAINTKIALIALLYRSHLTIYQQRKQINNKKEIQSKRPPISLAFLMEKSKIPFEYEFAGFFQFRYRCYDIRC